MARPQKTFGNLTIFDNGTDGLSYQIRYEKWASDTWVEYENCYGGISGDDMLDYTMEENLPSRYDRLNDEEKQFFISEYNRIRAKAKHKDYYDAYDNTWKNYY
jgi:hypothetical protein